ncbi:sensor histidine kinase [Helicobacter sp. T3_23-1056]
MWGKILGALSEKICTIFCAIKGVFLDFVAKFLKFLSKIFAIKSNVKSTKSSDTFTSTTYKILLLYLGTSVCFLGIIFLMMYKRELHNLRAQQSIQMRNDFIQIATQMAKRDFKTTKGKRRETHKKEEKRHKNLQRHNPAFAQKLYEETKQKEELEKLKDKDRQREILEFLSKLKTQNQTTNQATNQNLQTLQKSQNQTQNLENPQTKQHAQNANMTTRDEKIFKPSDEISPSLLEFLHEIKSEINSPFALLDENLGVVYSDLGVGLEFIPEIFLNRDGFLHLKPYIFVNFSRNKNLDMLFRHPLGASKLPKEVSKYLDRQGWIFILQGEAVEIGSDFFSNGFGNTKFSEPKEIESIQKEILSIRLELIGLMLLSLSFMAIVAYALVRLSLRPIKSQIKHLERFIKDTTHEVNTPLSVILMSVQKFDTQHLSEANKKRLHHIKLSAKNLHQMYQNLIFLNFYEGKNALESIDMAMLINERVEYFSALLAQKHITLESNLKSNAKSSVKSNMDKGALKEGKIYANKDEITIMLDNLLSNAIKYNHKGGKIYINLRTTAQNDAPYATLEITDSGYGIESKDLDVIFQRYKRFNDDKGGFGIGLSLVGEIAKKYDIDIEVQSEVGRGSTFTLSWKM